MNLGPDGLHHLPNGKAEAADGVTVSKAADLQLYGQNTNTKKKSLDEMLKSTDNELNAGLKEEKELMKQETNPKPK